MVKEFTIKTVDSGLPQSQYGRVHPTLLYDGSFVIIEQTFEALTFDTATWRAIAKTLYSLFYMPRVLLCYSTEKLDPSLRKHYLAAGRK